MDLRIVSIDGKVSKYISEHLAKNPAFLKRNGYVLGEPSMMVTEDPKAEYAIAVQKITEYYDEERGEVLERVIEYPNEVITEPLPEKTKEAKPKAARKPKKKKPTSKK